MKILALSRARKKRCATLLRAHKLRKLTPSHARQACWRGNACPPGCGRRDGILPAAAEFGGGTPKPPARIVLAPRRSRRCGRQARLPLQVGARASSQRHPCLPRAIVGAVHGAGLLSSGVDSFRARAASCEGISLASCQRPRAHCRPRTPASLSLHASGFEFNTPIEYESARAQRSAAHSFRARAIATALQDGYYISPRQDAVRT